MIFSKGIILCSFKRGSVGKQALCFGKIIIEPLQLSKTGSFIHNVHELVLAKIREVSYQHWKVVQYTQLESIRLGYL